MAGDPTFKREYCADHRQAHERQRGNCQFPPPRSPVWRLPGILGVVGTRGVELVIPPSRAIGLRGPGNKLFRFVDRWPQRPNLDRPGQIRASFLHFWGEPRGRLT